MEVTGRREIAPKMGQEDYFRVNRGPNRMDSRVAGAHASCYGVNLDFAGWGFGGVVLGVFPQAVRACPFMVRAWVGKADALCAYPHLRTQDRCGGMVFVNLDLKA
jgi:hypothetical protein